MKTYLTVATALVLSVIQPNVTKAASFTFYFDMPAFTEKGGNFDNLFGKKSVLALAMSNGGSDPFNEVFAMRDLIGAQVVSIAGTALKGSVARISGFNNPFDDPNQPLVTTDGTGKATLSVVSSTRAAALFSSTAGARYDGYQLAFTGPSRYRACTYSIDIGSESGGLCGDHESFSAVGRKGKPLVFPAIIPLPASLPLLVGAFGLVGFIGMRARKLSSSI